MAGNLRDQAYNIAVSNAEEQLIESTRSFEDSERQGDANGMAYAYESMRVAQANLDRITGADQPQQPGLSQAQQAYLDNRRRLGDNVDHPDRLQEIARAHVAAVAAGFAENSPQYFAAITGFLDHLGDGRQPVLDERSAAQVCGVSEQEYAQNAQKLRALKARGYYPG